MTDQLHVEPGTSDDRAVIDLRFVGDTHIDADLQRHGAHLQRLREALDELHVHSPTLAAWSAQLCEVLGRGDRLLVAGNGGSAAQAQHLTAELVGRFDGERPAFSAIALCADTASSTAISNDYGHTEVFVRQVEAHGRPGDVFLALSTSGRSPNVVAATRRAERLGLTTWALTGRGPNPLTDAAGSSVAIGCDATPIVQEVHQVVIHLLCEGFDARLPRPA